MNKPCICLILLTGIACTAFAADAQAGEAALREAERLAWLRNWAAALPAYNEAERSFEAAGDKRNLLFIQISKLRAEMDARPYLETSAYLSSLLDDPLVVNDLALRLRCLVVKGDIDLEADTNLAKRDWQEARAIAEKLGDKGWVNRADGELAVLAFLAGDYKAALLGIYSTIKRAAELNDLGSLIRYKALMGMGALKAGHPDRALRLFDDALSVAQTNDDVRHPVLVYSGKIDALITLNRTDEARRLLDSTLAAAHARSSVSYEAELRYRSGLLEWKHGTRQRAITELREAAQLAKAIGAERTAAQSSFTLAQVLESAGALTEAQTVIAESIAASRRAGDRLMLPATLAEAGKINVAMGRLGIADDYFEEGAEVAGAIIATVPTITAKDRLIATLDDLYIRHFQIHAQRRDTAGAFRILEQARGRAVADALRNGGVDARPLTAQLTEPEKRVARLQLQLMRSTNRSERRRLLAALEHSEDDLYPALASTAARVVRPSQSLSLSSLQRGLAPNETVLEYLIAESKSYCLVATHARTTIAALPGKADIEKAIKAHLDAIDHGNDLRATGRKLADALIPKGVTIPADLVVVPDGPLHRLPFDTLYLADGEMLMAGHTVSYAPSGTVLHTLARRRPTPASLPLLAVATGVDGTVQPIGAVRRGMFDLDGSVLPPLPSANGEARMIAEILGPSSTVIVGPAATKSAVRRQPLDHYQVLHFAVHGLTSPDHPERSGLVFFPDESVAEDGLWQLRDIARSKLQADLVTLSACKAGSGKVMGSAGIANLTTAFLAAGAKSVVANLWDSDDTFTRALMASFYKHLAQKEPTATALRHAKLDMQQKFGAEAPPRLWAGFTATGVNRAILQ